ncbi:MAG: methionyl-tRNA formyltransferase [Oceanococcaceae bacterium]
MRIVFAGTPEFAAGPLEALIDAGADVVGVLTQPDRPSGRGRKVSPSPVRLLAQRHGIPNATPLSLKDAAAQQALAAWEPDVLVVIAYGLLLPPAVLQIPPRGCVNVHASLLPRWRGAAPIQRAVEAGDTITGLCLMQMDAGLDTGPVLAEERLAIGPDMTAGELHDALCARARARLPGWMTQFAAGDLAAITQPEDGVSYAHKLTKAEALLDLSASAVTLARRVRAFDPWPVATVSHRGERLRLLGAAQALAMRVPDAPGTVLSLAADGVRVATGEGVLCVPEMQWPGRKRMAAAQALQSRGLAIGDVLGDGGGHRAVEMAS